MDPEEPLQRAALRDGGEEAQELHPGASWSIQELLQDRPRSSILKPARPVLQDINTNAAAAPPAPPQVQGKVEKSRMVSFSRNQKIKKFAPGQDNLTVWDSSYHEEMQGNSSAGNSSTQLPAKGPRADLQGGVMAAVSPSKALPLNMAAIFEAYGDHPGREAELKDQLRAVIEELEAAARKIHTLLQRVHRPGGVAGAAALAAQATLEFAAVQALYTRLDAQLPPNSFWKYSQLWSTTTSWIAFLAALTVYLGSEALATREQVAGLLGLTTTTNLRLDVEEYLAGLCPLSNELSRLTVNCVTSEDYSRPGRVAAFLNSLHTGFRLLNLKNDNLRKMFDSIKYDLKKVEEVVYDLSIRGLGKPEKEEGAEKEVKE